MKTLALVRVSTEKQSVSSQREAIEAWAAAQSVAVHEWVDEGDVSGAAGIDERVELKALLARVASPENDVDRLVVTEWSRIGRVADETLHHVMTMHRAGVRIVVLDDGYVYDFDDPMDQVRLFLGFAMDHGDRLKTIKRTRRAAVRRADGKVRTLRKDGTLGPAWGRQDLPTLTEAEWGELEAALASGRSKNSIVKAGLLVSPHGGGEKFSVAYTTLTRMLKARAASKGSAA